MKKCLVIGGSGFLGKNLCQALLKKGFKVTVIDKKKINLKKIKFVKLYTKNINSIEPYFKKTDFVFHLAGISSLNEALSKPIQTVNENILATVKLLNLSVKYNIKRFIYSSSIYTISEQGGFYRVSKSACENYIMEYQKRYGLNYTILRYGSLYGQNATNENTIRQIISNYKKTKKIIYNGNKKNIRNYINVEDASKATIETLSSKYKNKIVLIKGPKNIKVSSLMGIIKRKLNSDSKIIFKKNNTDIGHYIKLPQKVIVKKGQELRLKKYISIDEGIKKIIKSNS